MLNDNKQFVLQNPVHFLSYQQALNTVSDSLQQGTRINVVTPYATFWRYAETDDEFREAWHSADLALPDGVAVLWARRMCAYTLSSNMLVRFIQVISYAVFNFGLILAGKLEKKGEFERVSGADLVPDLLKYAEENNKSVYIIGGWKEVLDGFTTEMNTHYPNLRYQIDEQVAGADVRTDAGEKVLTQAIDRMQEFKPDLLIVSFGPPFQEKWSYKHFDRLHASVVINAGATIDFLSGRMKRAPKLLRKTGLEWLWRLITQPTRLRRVFYAFPYFPFKVVTYLITSPQSGIDAV